MGTPLTIVEYNAAQKEDIQEICALLELTITKNLSGSTSKIWHKGPVWFIKENPIIGYWVRKSGEVQLLFWSGQSLTKKVCSPKAHLWHPRYDTQK